MENKTLLTQVALCVTILVVGVLLGALIRNSETFGTDLTQNTATLSYVDGGDLYQNVQAISERMAGRTEGQLLQADSQGRMQAVAPGSVAGVWSFNQYEEYEAVTATNTLAITESGKTVYLSGAPGPQTLPTSTTAGQVFRFVVAGALTSTSTITTSGGENVIEGQLNVAGAVVDCDAEDTISFVGDGENIGDFVELRSNGTNWFIGSNSALTSAKLTCTAS